MKKKLIIIGCVFSIIIILLSSLIIFDKIYNKSNNNYLDLFSNNISILAVISSPKKLYKDNPIAFQIIQYVNGNDITLSNNAIDWKNPCGYCKLDNGVEWYFLSVYNKDELMKVGNFKNYNVYFHDNYCIWNSNSNHAFQLPLENNKTLRHDSHFNKIFSKIGMPKELFIYKKIENETVTDIATNFFINDKNTLLCHGCCSIPNNSSLKILYDTPQNDDLIFKYIPDDPMAVSLFSLNIPEHSKYIHNIMQYIFDMSSLHDYYKNSDNNNTESQLKIFWEDIEELLKFKYKIDVKIEDLLQQVQGNASICIYSLESVQLLEQSKQSKTTDFFSSLIICKLFEKKELHSILNSLALEKKIDSEGIYLAKEKDKDIYKLMIKNSLDHEQSIYFCIIDDYYFCLSSSISLLQKAQAKNSHFNEFIEKHCKKLNTPHCTVIQIDKLGNQVIQWIKQNQNNSSLNSVLDKINKILMRFSSFTLNIFRITEDLSFECKIQIKDYSWNKLYQFIQEVERRSYNKNNSNITH